MRIFCLLGQHVPKPGPVWNEGFYFSQCEGCGRDMIGRCGTWRTVPRGLRVVWRSASEAAEARHQAEPFHASPSLSTMILSSSARSEPPPPAHAA